MKWSSILAWLIELDARAEKDLEKLDRQIAKRITKFLRERVAALDDPRSIGEALRGNELGDYWKYRCGDYRIVASIEDASLVVYVVEVGHRREIYRH
jgi:mRNA interferase RelE/StbE